MPLCVGKRRTDRQPSHPEPPNAQAGLPPHQRHARSFPAERSIAAPRRTSTSAAHARSRAHRAGLAVRGSGQRRRGVSRLGNRSATRGRPGASRPCLSELSITGAQRPRCRPPGLWQAPLGQRPEESGSPWATPTAHPINSQICMVMRATRTPVPSSLKLSDGRSSQLPPRASTIGRRLAFCRGPFAHKATRWPPGFSMVIAWVM